MQTQSGFTLMEIGEFSGWLSQQKVTRSINRIQLHHTWSPSYQHFTGNNHFKLQSGMKSAHLSRGFSDIAQQFTIFPDGTICTGRSLNTAPAGITGANTGAVCIEILGNFDSGGDTMTDEQGKAVIQAARVLLSRFSLLPETAITYHCWWTAKGVSLGDYVPGKSANTCPGTAFFGGNTRAAFERELLPYLKGEYEMITKAEVEKMIAEAQPKRYQKVEEMPTWYREEIKALVDAGKLVGDEKGNLNLTEDMIRTLIISNRG